MSSGGSIALARWLVLLLLCPLAVLDARCVWSQDVLIATPYRPTISNPAELSATGHLELSGGYRRGTDNFGQALAAVGYSLSKTVVLDAGFGVGLASGAPDRTVFFGMTVLFR